MRTPTAKKSGQQFCDNGQQEAAEASCPTHKNLWFSAFDHVEPGKVHAQLTWNPYLAEMAAAIKHPGP